MLTVTEEKADCTLVRYRMEYFPNVNVHASLGDLIRMQTGIQQLGDGA